MCCISLLMSKTFRTLDATLLVSSLAVLSIFANGKNTEVRVESALLIIVLRNCTSLLGPSSASRTFFLNRPISVQVYVSVLVTLCFVSTCWLRRRRLPVLGLLQSHRAATVEFQVGVHVCTVCSWCHSCDLVKVQRRPLLSGADLPSPVNDPNTLC